MINFLELETLISQSQAQLGINYHILVEEPFRVFKENIRANDIEKAASNANALLHTIKKIDAYELHKNLGNAFLNLLYSIGKPKHIASIHMQLAVSYDMENNFVASEEHFHAGVRVIEPFAESGDTVAINILAGLWYNRCQQVRNGESKAEIKAYAAKAMLLYEQIDYKRGIMLCLNQIGTLTESNKIEERIRIYQRIVTIANETGDWIMGELAHVNWGYAEIENGNHAYGFKLMENGVREIEKSTSGRYAALANLNLAEAYHRTGRNTEALEKCNFSEEIFTKAGITVYSESIKLLRHNILEQLGKN